MDILGQDNVSPILKNRWRNAATDDLAVIDKSLSAKIKELADMETKYDSGLKTLKSCQNQGAFYSCLKNTGKSESTWENYIIRWRGIIAQLKVDIAALEPERAAAVERIRQEALAAGETAEAAGKTAEAASKESAASAGKAGAIGLWIVVALAAIAGGALIYFKIIKKK